MEQNKAPSKLNYVEMEQESIGSNLIKTLEIKDLQALTRDIAELGIDKILDNDLIKEVPIVKTIHALYKTGVSVRDRILVKKIVLFLSNCSTISTQEKEAFIVKLEENDKHAEEVGEHLFLILDKLNSFDKPKYLALLFVAFMKGQLTIVEFEFLSETLDRIDRMILNKLIEFSRRRSAMDSREIEREYYWSRLGSIRIGFNESKE